MPRTGTPMSNRPGSIEGAPSSYTEAGPPDRISPAGRRLARSADVTSWGTISEYTCASRTRRAISWAYWAPKSTTRTGLAGSSIRDPGTKLVAHPHPLRSLVRLAFGLDGRRDHELRLLELLDRGVAGGGHRRGQGAEQVEGPVVLVRGTHEDLLQGGDLLGLHPGATRERRVERRHSPVVAAARRLVGTGERRPDHHRVRAAGDRLRDVAARAHPAVRDHVAVPARLVQVLAPGRGRVRDRGGLGHSHPEDTPCGACVPRTNAHQDAHGARPHQVQGG